MRVGVGGRGFIRENIYGGEGEGGGGRIY